jgi:8-oxo-dGTP pyrophosphatase MutT (NUDIX family)
MTSGGCIFTDGTYVLAGLQIKDERKLVSGFGGKALEKEESIHAALRETVEELLELFDIPHIIDDIFVHYIPQRFFQNGTYLLLQYTFEDLEDILKTIQSYNMVSPVYEAFPLTIQELLFKRKRLDTAEIQALAFLPLADGMQFDDAFLSDIALLLKT